MQNWYSNVERWREVSGLRPSSAEGKVVTVLEAPRAWWQFAVNAVVEFLPSHIFKTKLRMYIDGALEYDALFKRKYSNAEYAAGRLEGRPWYSLIRQESCFSSERSLNIQCRKENGPGWSSVLMLLTAKPEWLSEPWIQGTTLY